MDLKSISSRGMAIGVGYSVQGVRELQKRLKAIEPELRTQFMREIKKIAVVPNQAIRNAIPASAPLSGMSGESRISWGVNKPAKSTTIRFRTKSGGTLTTNLLSIRVNSAASSMADMAGRSGRSIGAGYRGSGYTREFIKRRKDGSLYYTKRRTTREAGQKFVSSLNSRTHNTASRFAWKPVEKSLPALNRQVQEVINKYYRIANYRMVRG